MWLKGSKVLERVLRCWAAVHVKDEGVTKEHVRKWNVLQQLQVGQSSCPELLFHLFRRVWSCCCPLLFSRDYDQSFI